MLLLTLDVELEVYLRVWAGVQRELCVGVGHLRLVLLGLLVDWGVDHHLAEPTTHTGCVPRRCSYCCHHRSEKGIPSSPMMLLIKPGRKVKIEHVLDTLARHNTLRLIPDSVDLFLQTSNLLLECLPRLPLPGHTLCIEISFPYHLLFLVMHVDPHPFDCLLDHPQLLRQTVVEALEFGNVLSELLILFFQFRFACLGLF